MEKLNRRRYEKCLCIDRSVEDQLNITSQVFRQNIGKTYFKLTKPFAPPPLDKIKK